MKVYSGNCHEFRINARMEKCVTLDAKWMARDEYFWQWLKIFWQWLKYFWQASTN